MSNHLLAVIIDGRDSVIIDDRDPVIIDDRDPILCCFLFVLWQ